MDNPSRSYYLLTNNYLFDWVSTYSDFKTLLGIDSTELLIGIDEPGELDYDKILVNLEDGIDDSTFPTVELDPFTPTFTNPVNSTIPNPDNS